MRKFMFDTNIFNHICDNGIEISGHLSNHLYYITHVQYDEIYATKNISRREELLSIFQKIEQDPIATETFTLDISKLDKAKLGISIIYGQILSRLEKIKRKKNNIQDALIAETAITKHLVLVTDDKDLLIVISELGGEAINFNQFMNLARGAL